MKPYFDYTETDKRYYEANISNRIPKKVFDAHVHVNLPEHVAMVPDERWLSDWALECGHLLPAEDAYACAKQLFPGVEYHIAGFPWPIKEADMRGNNRYLAEMKKKKKLSPFMAVRPEWNIDEIEKTLIEGDFVGFKPYPDMVTGVKGADISIFDFFPKPQWQLLNKHKKAVMLHLPRKERLADKMNIKELLDARQTFAEVAIIIAHFGRSFVPYYLAAGLAQISDIRGFYFDTSAVINPAVYELAFDKIPSENIIYGSDMPITFWHGKREWTERDYVNICRENFTWKKIYRSKEEEARYTVFLYEEVRSILDMIDKKNLGDEAKNKIFYENAMKALKLQ